MKLNPTQHALLDYLTIAAFALAPSVLSLSNVAAMLSYALAAVHLLVTVCTDFSGGVFRWLPLPWHGKIEAIVAPVLIITPWILDFDRIELMFFVAAGVAIFLVWLATDYAPSLRRQPS